jgi:TM2 domain-containing membrane protein YozV
MAARIAKTKRKDRGAAAIYCSAGFMGLGGLHYFYIGKPWMGLIYLCTGGLFLVGTIVDMILILGGGFRDSDGYIV